MRSAFVARRDRAVQPFTQVVAESRDNALRCTCRFYTHRQSHTGLDVGTVGAVSDYSYSFRLTLPHPRKRILWRRGIDQVRDLEFATRYAAGSWYMPLPLSQPHPQPSRARQEAGNRQRLVRRFLTGAARIAGRQTPQSLSQRATSLGVKPADRSLTGSQS